MSGYSVKKPITVIMGVLIIIVLGVFSLTRLPLTLFPDIELPYLVTITEYQGASPEQVEQEVSTKIEATVGTIGNFSEVSSMSNEHFGISIVTFSEGSNMDSIVVELRELLNNITFNEGVGNTRILRISPDMLPVVTVTLFRDYEEVLSDDEQLIQNTEWINRQVLLELQSIPGVADVSLSGAADVVLNINLDPVKLAPYGLTNQEVLTIIEAQNVGGLVGIALDNGQLRMLYLGDKIQTIEEISTLPIYFDGGNVIELNELVLDNGIQYVNANTDTYSKINGEQGIQVSFTKQSNYGITEVANNVIDKLDEVIENEGESAHYEVLLNQGDYINQSIGSVLQNLIIGGILAIIILFIFLKDIKPTIIVGLAIPISVVAAFMLMYFTNVSLNLVSMGGLALGIGMLVDNAVVVIENIYRMISEGKSRKEASVEGAKQVAGAITASTITTVAVFLPIVFIEGMIADVFLSMAYTIAFSLGASLFIALTLVPMMASRMLEDKKVHKEGKFLTKIKQAYEASVLFTIKHKVKSLITVLFLLILSTFLVVRKGFILLPQSDEGVISVEVITPSQTSFQDKSLYADSLTEVLMALEDVETVSGTIGGSSNPFSFMSGSNQTAINLSVTLKENRLESTKYYETKITNILKENAFSSLDYDALEVSVASQNSTGALGGASGINIKVSGYDLDTLENIANDITNILAETDGVRRADNGISQGADRISVVVNKDNAMKLGMTTSDVNENMTVFSNSLPALLGSLQTESISIQIEGVTYDIEVPVTFDPTDMYALFLMDYAQFLSGIKLFDRNTLSMINAYTQSGKGIYLLDKSPMLEQGLPKFIVNPYLRVIDQQIVFVEDIMSTEVSLASLAVSPLFTNSETSVVSIEKATGFSTISTDGTNRYLTVTAQVDKDRNVTLVSQEATNRVNDYLASTEFTKYGNGYYVTFEGESEEILQAVSDLAIAALVAILLVYMVMAIQFQSLLYPFIILGTIPLAFTGGMFALLITNSNLSLVSIMGLIVLVGIVVNNGIVLIDYINKLRESGKGIIESIVEAGKTRIRPIFMTSLTTILGLAAMAIGFGEGSELLQPMAITAIGGLIYSTILTLVIVPAIYAIFNRKKIKKEAMKDVSNER
ncbi:MAG: efflux RND transporter permease subunit [Acholeplasma sp.]|nr:efflux RND transporter permease subunit [Acholeplasma sp.]